MQLRAEGESSYSLRRLLRFATDNMLSFSNKPLRLMVTFGFMLTALAFAVGVYYFVQHLAGQILVDGFTTLVLSLWLLGGMIIMFLGIVGIYIGKTFNQTKARPTFVISERVGKREKDTKPYRKTFHRKGQQQGQSVKAASPQPLKQALDV